MSESLEGFSEAHVIGEDSIELVRGEEMEPIDAGLLVVTELGTQGSWDGDGLILLGLGNLLTEFF